MTRTDRSVSPRAIIRDRSESKTGQDGHLRKGGAGPHNWGSLRDELELERQGLEDAALDREELDANRVPGTVNGGVRADITLPEGKDTNLGDNELLRARETRAKGLDEGADLATIARTSAGASSSPSEATIEISRDAPTSSLP